MNSKELEMIQNYEIKDNDEEDDKMEEKEINAQLNIISENDNFMQKNDEEYIEKINKNNIDNENDNMMNINLDNINIENNGLSGNKSIFENPYLQTSYNLFTKLRRIIIRKENLTKINYFDKWQKIIRNKKSENEKIIINNNNSNNNALIQNRNIIQNILNEENEQTEQILNIENNENKSHNDVILEHQNQLLKSGNQNFQALINPFASINDMNFETDYSYLNNNNNNNENNININNESNNNDNDNNITEKLLNINNNISKEKKNNVSIISKYSSK